MMHLFVIASIYQLFNALNIINSKNDFENVEICILNFNNTITEKIDLAYLENKVKKVRIIDIYPTSGKAQKILLVLKSKVKKIFNRNKLLKYASIYLSGTEVFSKIILFYFRDTSTQIFYYEDGVASYYSVLNSKTKQIEDFVFKILYGFRPLEKCKSLYIYSPKAVCNNSYGIPLNKIEGPNINTVINMKKVFLGKYKDFSKKYVFLSTWFEDEDKYKLQQFLIQQFLKSIENSKCVIKVHPSDRKINMFPNVECLNDSCCFEILNLNFNFEKNVFITIISTAAITPKIIYNQEPVIIFLFKIFQKRYIDEWRDIEVPIRKLLAEYNHKERIFIPESMEEFTNILGHLNENLFRT